MGRKIVEGDWAYHNPVNADDPRNNREGTETVEVEEGQSEEIALRHKVMELNGIDRILTAYVHISNIQEVHGELR